MRGDAFVAAARSLRTRGLLGTLARARPVLEMGVDGIRDRLFDLHHGTDTAGIVELADVPIESENKIWGVRCQPTPVRLLRRMLGSLRFPEGSAFVDFGCGKGRALLLAAETGAFRRVAGVDFSADFCAIARENVARHGRKRGAPPGVEILHLDAVDYRVREDDTVFFFFNPFSEEVLRRVLANVAASLARKDRSAYLLYYNPVWEGVVERASPFRLCREHPPAPCRFGVFANRSGAPGLFPAAPSGALRIEPSEGVNPHAWERLLGADPGATFFHTLPWGRLLERFQPSMKPRFLLAWAGGDLVGGLPFVRLDRRGLHVLASMPYGTYGGPLALPGAPSGTREGLVRRFFEMAGAPRVAFAELVDLSGTLDAGAYGTRRFDDETHLLDLTAGYEAVWKGMKGSCRNRIRKAETEGLVVRRAETIAEFRAYHPLMVATCRRNRAPVLYGPRFLEGLWYLRDPGIQMWLAWAGDEIVAGELNLACKETVLNWGVVSRDAGHGSAANLIHARAIEAAARDGRSVYNFGSSLGFQGLARFKESFGARPVPYRHLVSEKRWFPFARRWSRNLG